MAQTNQPVVEDFKPSTLNQPGQQYTAHEFLTWRRSLYQFAPLLFLK